MYEVRYIERDGFRIVGGFNRATVDPESTLANLKRLLKAGAEKPEPSDVTIYFQSRSSELINEKRYTLLKDVFSNLKENEQLCLDNGVICDYVGERYWIEIDSRWTSRIVDRLGETVPENGKAVKNISKEELQEILDSVEIDRIKGLNINQRKEEFKAREEEIIKAATATHSRLLIMGDDKALEKAKQYYTDETQKERQRYNLIE
jgi:hypothetical protein